MTAAAQKFDVVVLGAGAAGMMCAAEAGKRGQRVLLLEHGHDQSGAVVTLFQRHGFSDIRTHMDLSGNPRVTRGILHSQRGTS